MNFKENLSQILKRHSATYKFLNRFKSKIRNIAGLIELAFFCLVRENLTAPPFIFQAGKADSILI